MSSVYGMKVAVQEMMEECDELMNYALKQSMSLDYLGNLDQDDLKAMAGLKRMSESVHNFLTEGTGVMTDLYERQEKIDRKLDEINRKLDKLSKDE